MPKNTAPEATTTPVEEAPKVDPAKDLAARATEYLDKDKVTPSQARAYTEFLGDSPLTHSVLANYDRDTLVAIAAKQASLSKEDAAAFRQAYSSLTPSHQWLKAIVATALALDDSTE